MRNALQSLLGGKKKGQLYFTPYSNHLLGHHGYKVFDGHFPCKDKDNAISIFGDLLANGDLLPNTAGMTIWGGNPAIEQVSIKEIRAALDKKQG
jgi:hypothetical protein